MKIRSASIPDVLIIEPDVFGDARGCFLETWNRSRYLDAGFPDVDFVQDNFSRSGRSVLRGIHFQRRRPQGKLVQVTRGAVFDVAVDLRPGSPTFGHWCGMELSEDNHRQIWIPEGFGHGFCVLSDTADFQYKCTDYYDPADEGGVRWNDTDIGIEWPVAAPVLSEKDTRLPFLCDLHEGALPSPATR